MGRHISRRERNTDLQCSKCGTADIQGTIVRAKKHKSSMFRYSEQQ